DPERPRHQHAGGRRYQGPCVEGTSRVPDPCRRPDEGRVQEHLVEAVLIMISRSLVAVSFLGLLSALALAQGQLPDAPGKDETVRMCGTCHEVERATSVRLSREGWQDTIAKMVDLGARASDEERAKVLDYLA